MQQTAVLEFEKTTFRDRCSDQGETELQARSDTKTPSSRQAEPAYGE